MKDKSEISNGGMFSDDMNYVYHILASNPEFDKKMNNGLDEDSIFLANAINLEVSVDDLYAHFLKACCAVDNLKGYNGTDLLKYYLERMKEFLDLLKKGSNNYNKSILNDKITEKKIDIEKKKYLSRRYLEDLDLY